MTATSAIGMSPAAANHVLGRKLDSIPFSPYHLMIIGVLGLVGFVDGYDLAVTGSLLVLARKPLQLTPADVRFLAVASTSMICVGGFAASAISDHFSRKTIMMIGVAAITFARCLSRWCRPPRS
jgi:MFS family permease